MKLGTKSILFGAHQFILHPIFVAIAYIRLYGFTFDPRIWIAFLVHDWGYWGKSDMDGESGKTHPELGARIMHELFDEMIYSVESPWAGCTTVSDTHWGNFTLYHSRFYATRDGVNPSKLCYADKLAFGVSPMWLYLLCVNLTGEIHEYMDNHKDLIVFPNHSLPNQIVWYKSLKTHFESYLLDNNIYK